MNTTFSCFNPVLVLENGSPLVTLNTVRKKCTSGKVVQSWFEAERHNMRNTSQGNELPQKTHHSAPASPCR